MIFRNAIIAIFASSKKQRMNHIIDPFMKKRFLFLAMAFVVCQGLQAQNRDALKYFNLVMPDHSLVSYGLWDVIEIHFQDSIMTVNDLSFFMEEGIKYFFSEEDLTEVNEHFSENNSYVSGNNLYVKSQKESRIVISDIMGRVVYRQSYCKDCIVDLSALSPNTLYVIKVNDQSIKFLKR